MELNQGLGINYFLRIKTRTSLHTVATFGYKHVTCYTCSYTKASSMC